MAVIVDTSVWVQFLRARGSLEHGELDRLLVQRQVVLVGAVLAEILQGARSNQEFDELSFWLAELPYGYESEETWIQVGALAYRLRQQGLMVGIVDLLIAALTLEHGHQLYTLDQHFQRVPGLRLYQGGK